MLAKVYLQKSDGEGDVVRAVVGTKDTGAAILQEVGASLEQWQFRTQRACVTTGHGERRSRSSTHEK